MYKGRGTLKKGLLLSKLDYAVNQKMKSVCTSYYKAKRNTQKNLYTHFLKKYLTTLNNKEYNYCMRKVYQYHP